MAEKENSKSENTETKKNEQIREYGQTKLEHNIHLLSVIGEIEGHECLSSNTKTTKYEHVLPQPAAIEDRSCHRRNDRINQQADCFSGTWRQPFDRCADRCLYRLFLYCPDRNDGHPSGPYEWNNHWSPTDL